MANTVIQLKHSTLAGNVPSSLANGEISINNRDGKFFYSTPAGAVITHYPYTGPAGLNQEVQFNDSGFLGSDSGLTYNKTTDVLTVVGGAIVGGVNVAPQIQSSYNQANSAFIHANAAFAAANTGGSATDSWSRNQANAAFIQANAAFLQANTPSHVANSAAIYANGAFAAANASAGTDLTQNTNITYAWNHANAAFDKSNTSSGAVVTFGANPPATGNSNGDIWIDSTDGTEYTYFKDADTFQWVEFGPASSNIIANTFVSANLSAQYTQANLAFNQANAAFIQANASFNTGNSAFIQANAAFTTGNAAYNQANAAFNQANTANTIVIDSTRLASNLKLNIIQVLESANIFTTPITGNVNIDIGVNTSYFFSSNTIGNVTFNLRGTDTTPFDATVGLGQTASVAIALKQGAIKYRANVYIDGVLQTPYWLGNSSPAYATAQQQSIDVYTYTVFKTAASTYSILAANSNFGLAQGQPGQG
jgi:hypothetical protein